MTLLDDYIVENKILNESNDAFIYRARSEHENNSVIIKVLKNSLNIPEEVERFKYEYELINSLHGNGTVKAYGIDTYQDHLALILEDFGTSSLETMLAEKKISPAEFLVIALSITEALEKIHNQHIIHKNINPSNILWDDVGKEAKIIDFAAATILSREIAEIRDAAFVQKSMLYYSSPEQTGRMNRGIDYRTDFYSLGIVFYQMLTGAPPFQSADINELVHFHIAKTPLSPHAIDPTIPENISNIVMKLLAKMAEDRYQSLFGLKEDLKLCIHQLKHGKAELFVVGQKDFLTRFQISEKLYGREEDLEHLLKGFYQASQEHARLILVTGQAGIGKSSLVHELYKPLVENHGYFIAGKFDQFKRNIPYSSLAQAFEAFIQQILTMGGAQIETWRSRLLESLGPNAKIIVDIIPDLVSIVGEQPVVPILGPAETQNRFNIVFQNFIRTLAQPDHPLAIFLDDLQWADLPSLKLLENLLTYPESKHFLIIGSYRDNEVDAAHILTTSLNTLRKANFSFNTINLRSLSLKDVVGLLIDTLHHNATTVMPLAKICFEKTQGNPFFLNQFLQTLNQEGLIAFNFVTGGWDWDIEKIQQKGITSNVVELIVKKLQELPAETQWVIQLASCLGNRFSLKKLSLINSKPHKETANELREALDKGLIVPTDTAYKYISNESNTDVIYQFSHDRVQQATYSLIKDEDRDALRLKIGRVLLETTPPEKIDDSVIEIVNQANFGIDLITDPVERKRLAELNLLAGKKAKDSVAYKVALNYLKTGIQFLPKDAWQSQYDLTLELYIETIEASYLAMEFDELKVFSGVVIDNAKTLLDKLKIYEIRILYLTTHNEYEDAINVMLSVLSSIGINLPKHPTKAHIVLYLIRTKLLLLGKNIPALENQPEMDDANWQAALRIIRCAAGATYLANSNLFVVSGFEAIILLLKYGNTPQAGRSFIVYGHILCGALNQINIGYQFGELSLKLCDKYRAENIKAQVWMVHSVFVQHWHEHLNKSVALIFDAFQKGLETGDIEYAGYSVAGYTAMRVLVGDKLNSIEQEMAKYEPVIISIDQKTALHWITCWHQLALNLMGATNINTPTLLKSKIFDEDLIMPKLIAKKDNVGGMSVCTSKLMLCYLFKDYQQGYKWGKKGANFINAIGVFILPSYYFLYSLTCIACFTEAGDKMKSIYLKQVKNNQKKMRTWAKHAPMNYAHKFYLVEAELARLDNKFEMAETYYDQAIELAKEHHYVHEEAIAHELAARYYLQQGNERIAKSYINDAYQCYKNWGAIAKTNALEKEYSHLLENLALKDAGQDLALSLDLATVMKGSQAIVREIEFESLLKKLMNILIESAGAQKGYLLLQKNTEWFIEAESTIDQDQISVLQSVPINDRLPLSIVRHVIRTNSTLVIDDATYNDQFSFDPYIKKYLPKSIFCMPLVNQGNLSGIIYMENNLTKNAFTQNRINILNILSTQIVISIDNARQYGYRKLLSEAYERFVPYEYLSYLNKASISDVRLGDQIQKDMTVMVCDIRNFTSISEKLSPQACMDFLNNYLKRVEPSIVKNQGFIDKYIGDGIIAIFPSADDSLNASIAVLHVLEEYNAELAKLNQAPVHIGIGLSSGLVTLGAVGVARRMQGAVISEAVNIADRAEELTKRYHAPLIITEETYVRLKNLGNYAIRKLDSIKIGNKNTTLFQVFDSDPENQIGLKNLTINEFEQGIRFFQNRNFNAALDSFKHVLEVNTQDLTAAYYIEKCNEQINTISSDRNVL